MSSQILTLPDGRQIGYAEEGKGNPVVYFHGTASSRLEILFLKQFAHEYQFRLIGIDRPGYGLSSYMQRSRLSDFASDVNAVANHLRLSRFAVLSWSGGGPFALAYMALYPDRVTRAVAVGTPALPFDPATAHNRNPFAKFAMRTPFLAKFGLRMFRKSVLKAGQDIEGYLDSKDGKEMLKGWSKPDVQFFADPTRLKLMYIAVAEGFRQGGDSLETIYQEHRLFMKPWSEPVWQISPGKLTFWQGAQDKTCDTSNVQKYALTIKNARVQIFPDDGHCVIFTQPPLLAANLNGDPL
jgi:pimeloyl-ACP methyl ester carboxylesterase